MRTVDHRFVLPVLAALLTVGLTGCGNADPSQATTGPATTESSRGGAGSAPGTTAPQALPVKTGRITAPARAARTADAKIIADGTQTVLLLSYDSAAGKAVVQPAEVKTGDQDNAKVVPSGARVAVSVTGAVKLFSVNGGDPSCMAGTGYDVAGSCLTTKAKFQKLIVGKRGLPVRIASTQGRVHEISELYLP